MDEIIPINAQGGKRTVNARDLHEFLESKQDFSTWIKNRIEKFGFVESSDYLLHKFVEQLPSGAKHKIDYFLSIDMAKELSMVENNDKGREARRYFIEVEKQAKAPKSSLDILQGMLDSLRTQEERLLNVENDLAETKTLLSALSGEYFSVIGYASLRGIKADISLASRLGRKATRLSTEHDYPVYKIKDPRFGQLNTYHVDILKEVFESLTIDQHRIVFPMSQVTDHEGKPLFPDSI